MKILHAIEKSGHTTKNPKLRGIAIAPLLCRLYDILSLVNVFVRGVNRIMNKPVFAPDKAAFSRYL